MKYSSPNVSTLFLFFLGIITLLLPLSLHLFFPALPSVMADFATSESMVNLTVSGPLFVMAFMSLIYGFLSDRYGRRPVLLSSIVLFVSGSIVSTLAQDMWVLIAGRFLQAAGGGGGVGLARAIARDVFGADRLVKVLAYLTMAYAIGPMISAPLGGVLVAWAGWRAVLFTATIFGIIIGIVVYFFVIETHNKSLIKLNSWTPLKDFRALFTNLRFMAYVFQSGFSSSVFFTMAAATSFLMIEYLQRSPSEYGLYFICFPLGFLTGSLISSRLAGIVKIETMVLLASLAMVAGTLVLSAFLIVNIVTPLTIFLPGFFTIFAQGLALPNAQSGAINVAGPLAGSASGIGVSIQLLAGGVGIQAYGLVADGTPIPIAVTISACAISGLIVGAIPFILREQR